MARTSDDIRTILAQKFVKESARLKSWGTKTDDKAAVSFAAAVTETVRALMAESRYRELKRMDKVRNKASDSDNFNKRFDKYIAERLKATKQMATAIQNYAEKKEKERPQGYKKHEHKHKHHHHRRHK